MYYSRELKIALNLTDSVNFRVYGFWGLREIRRSSNSLSASLPLLGFQGLVQVLRELFLSASFLTIVLPIADTMARGQLTYGKRGLIDPPVLNHVKKSQDPGTLVFESVGSLMYKKNGDGDRHSFPPESLFSSPH